MRTTSGASGTLDARATRTSTTMRVVLVDTGQQRNVNLDVPNAVGAASVTRVSARSPYAAIGVSIGGAPFARGSTTGKLSSKPSSQTLKASGPGRCRITVGAHSAVLLTLKR